MPSIATQYTPLESLLFLQAIARNGADVSTLSSISQSLSSNQFIQEDEKYDANRLAPDALKSLYDELVNSEKDVAPPSVNGHSYGGDINPRKRKLLSVSPERLDKSEDSALKVSRMVDRLYARYRERIIQEIKNEEEEYQALVSDIKRLEEEAQGGPKPDETPAKDGLLASSQFVDSASNRFKSPAKDVPVPPVISPGDKTPPKDAKSKGESASAAQSEPRQTSSGQMLPPQTPGIESSIQRPPPTATTTQRQQSTTQRVSPALSKGVLPQSQQQIQAFPPKYGPIQPPQSIPSNTSPRPSNALPPLSSIVSQPPTQRTSPAQRRSSGSLPPRTSPLLPSPSPQYPQPSPYGYPYPAWPQYNSPTSPYANPQYYHQPPYPPNQTPVYHHYQPYSQPPPPNQYGPGPYPRPQIPSQTPQYPHLPWPAQPVSASTTPSVQRSGDRPRVRTWGTSTPWTPGGIRRGSPERPVRERDVSPLSDRAASPASSGDEKTGAEQRTALKDPSPKEIPKRGRGRGRNMRGNRAGSTHSSVLASRSRSQSLASVTSESRPERAAGGRSTMAKIKHETPTPAPFTSDNEQRPTGRRRGRSDALQLPSIEVGRNNSNKRKRESGTEPSPSPSLPTLRPFISRTRLRPEPIDPSLVSITKNFARMAAPILNDVNGHKLAGIFAKPLTEREAPGYKDLIYRPQDLKSIRAAVGRGSRAANALIDEMGAEAKADDSSTAGSPAALPIVPKTSTPSGSILVPKTEDLTPPKAIVNSAQLEMEFVRMFANAVMFNPLPLSERGLPPDFRMQRDRVNEKASSGGPNKKKSRKTKVEDEDHDNDEGHGGGGAGVGSGSGAGGDTAEKKGYVYAPEEEGGIIHDAREMFESVEKSVTQFRRVEQQGYNNYFGGGGGVGTDDIGAQKSSTGAGAGTGTGMGAVGLRGGSVSVSDAVAEESAQEDGGGGGGGGGGGEETTSALSGNGTGTARKRRRLLE